ncbi:hypothetical protein [Mangrovihabitans endophyticus]|uniref:Uncharacterized protein n=1 Tax=Mangrovihabitans endophyticus TaxID=1751298 RepID=A0A8J3FRK9_9ACTN|nr:hypothetical protein [Mangrovihabitans endophyticus]GGL12665.1 hypothetical protein GCM10012284_54200 [Mangrovihabitans endophyticus]
MTIHDTVTVYDSSHLIDAGAGHRCPHGGAAVLRPDGDRRARVRPPQVPTREPLR